MAGFGFGLVCEHSQSHSLASLLAEHCHVPSEMMAQLQLFINMFYFCMFHLFLSLTNWKWKFWYFNPPYVICFLILIATLNSSKPSKSAAALLTLTATGKHGHVHIAGLFDPSLSYIWIADIWNSNLLIGSLYWLHVFLMLKIKINPIYQSGDVQITKIVEKKNLPKKKDINK